MDNNKNRNDIIEVGKELLETKLVARTWGNISAREDDDNFLITPSGLDYMTMTPEDIVNVNISTGEWNGNHRPSGERGVHKAAYEVFSDVNFVVHTHQTYATAVALAGFESLDISEEEKEKLGGIATAAYGLPGTDKLTNAVKAAIVSGAHVVLMIHHGVLVLGKDREEAMNRTKLLEEICERNIKGRVDAGANDSVADEAALTVLKDQLKSQENQDNNITEIVSTKELICLSNISKGIVSQLDDVSQMIGAKVKVVSADKVAAALKKTNAVLVKGVGAVVKADNTDDVEALSVLVQKMAVVNLHTRAYKKKAVIGLVDSVYMHYDYINRYSKQKK